MATPSASAAYRRKRLVGGETFRLASLMMKLTSLPKAALADIQEGRMSNSFGLVEPALAVFCAS